MGGFIIDNTSDAGADACAYDFLRACKNAASNSQSRGVMIATPCSSFSLAVSRAGKALRSKSYPRGLPIPMTARERNRIDEGSRALDATINMIKICNTHRIPLILANPASSYVWQDPNLTSTLKDAITVRVDQCAFGDRWRKMTRLSFGNFR